ncbi:Ankyrin repeat-containing domain protein [Elaphomyces granulatus]
MPFSDLPRVIILEIADQLDDVGVNVLLRTNRQIYDLLNRYLYRRDLKRTQSRSLLWAVHRGTEAQATTMVQRAIVVCGHLDLIPESFHIALQASAKEGRVHLVELLLKVKGINPNFGDSSQTPLALAVRGGHVSIVELLLAAANIDPNVTVGCFGDHILAYSTYYGHQKTAYAAIVKLLLDRPDIDPNVVTADAFRRPVLTWASAPALVRLFLDRKDIDVNKQDNKGYTALWRAACSNNFEIAKLLLDRDDINVNLSDMGGRTPLFHACHCRHLSIVRLLLKKDGIDPNARDNDGCTPLAHACHLDCLAFGPLPSHLAVVRSLLSHPDTDPNVVDNNGVRVLAYVIDNVTPRYGEKIESLLRTAGARR